MVLDNIGLYVFLIEISNNCQGRRIVFLSEGTGNGWQAPSWRGSEGVRGRIY